MLVKYHYQFYSVTLDNIVKHFLKCTFIMVIFLHNSNISKILYFSLHLIVLPEEVKKSLCFKIILKS